MNMLKYAVNMVAGSLLIGTLGLASDNLEKSFVNPPREAKPWVYWWFNGGYGNPEGMARDIDAMKEKGIGGVMHMQTVNMGGLPLAAQPQMLSPEWDAWFGEALRLANKGGMTLSASILDGWSHGGWWVGKEDGAKQLVYTETQVEGGGRRSCTLPQPLTRLGVYHDVAVVAFKEKVARPVVPLDVTANNVCGGYCGEQNWPAIHAVDNDPETYWRIASPCSNGTPAVLDLTYAEPRTMTGAIIVGLTNAGPAECEIQVSDEGKTYRPITKIEMIPGERKRMQFAAVTARHFRLSITRSHKPDLCLAEFQLLQQGDEPCVRPGIKWWDFKSANRAWWGWPPKPYDALEEEYAEDGVSDVAVSDVKDLTSHLGADGRLDWTFPAGRWTVLRFGWTQLAEPARMGSGGYEVDVLNTKGADLMMDRAGRRMRELSIKCAAGAPVIFHTDSWEIGAGLKGFQPTWTDDFGRQFKTRRGYDMVAYLPALARRIVGDRLTTDRFLRDYRDTVADLLAAYYGRLQERAHEMKGGINSESGYGSYPHPHMDGLQIFGRADRPMAEFWHPYGKYSGTYLQEVDIMRTAASGARIYGNRFVQAETLTFSHTAGLLTPPAAYRRTLHEAWARGLNQAVICLYTHQPSEDKPGLLAYDILNRHFPWWPLADGFISYIARSQYLLQQGDFVADMAYFVGEGATRFVPGKAFLKPAMPAGYDYDGINAEVLLTRAKVKNGRLVLPVVAAAPGIEAGVGPSYRYLVLSEPQCRTMNVATLAQIRELVEQGMTLVGKRPTRTPGLSNLAAAEARLKKEADVLWGESSSEQGDRKVGRGRVVWGRTPGEIALADGVLPDCEGDCAGTPVDLIWLHRRTGSAELYFLANPLKRALDVTVHLRTGGNVAQVYDPLDGASRDLPETRVAVDGRLTVPLHFEAEQAVFVVVKDRSQKSEDRSQNKRKNFPGLTPVQELAGAWDVEFDSKWFYDQSSGDRIQKSGAEKVKVAFEMLEDWTKRTEDAIKSYSGVAVYRKTFDVKPDVCSLKSAVCLDLGTVRDMARVRLNGRDLGVAWCPPWRVRIPDGLLREKGNELEIAVANTWHNRLAADYALPEKERLTRVGHNLHAQCAKQGFQPAGLTGPVMLVGEK